MQPEEERQPLIEFGSNPPVSANWEPYSDSMFSQRHLTPGAKRQRTSNSFLTLVNLIKVCIGISFLSVSVGISQAGIYGAFVGSIYVMIVNVFA